MWKWMYRNLFTAKKSIHDNISVLFLLKLDYIIHLINVIYMLNIKLFFLDLCLKQEETVE